MQQRTFIIVGLGVAGTWLSYFLLKKRQKVIVYDNGANNTASRIAAGMMTAVSGRKLGTTPDAATIFPETISAYRAIEQELGIKVLDELEALLIHPNEEWAGLFAKREDEGNPYLQHIYSTRAWEEIVHFNHGLGIVAPAYTVQLPLLLDSWRDKLLQKGLLREEVFEWNKVQLADNSVTYGETNADVLLCCAGINGAKENTFFKGLPYSPNKGEALIADIPDLPRTHIYKQRTSIAPFAKNTFWIGSGYAWEYDDALPTEAFRRSTERWLEDLLKIPWKITGHVAAERAGTVGQVPFVGLHPKYLQLGLLNGMGSKGCLMAPYLAKLFAGFLTEGTGLPPKYDIARRYLRILNTWQ